MFNLKKIFSKLNKPKKYLSCNWAEHGVNFYLDEIKTCCMCFNSKRDFLPSMENKDHFDYKKLFAIKKNFRNLFKKNSIPTACKSCAELIEKEWDNKDYISHINFDTSLKCNANCTYCFTAKKKEYFNSLPEKKLFSQIKNLLDKNLIVPGGEIMFGGGEPTINEEFESLLNLFLDKGFNYFRIHSSGIKYSKAIERCLNEGKVDLIISPDSGEKDLYEKIKRVHRFDDVWENIKKYSEAQGENKFQVKAKYILLPEINDSVEDINNFFKKIEETSVKSVNFDVEINSYLIYRVEKEKMAKLFTMLKYAEKKAEEQGLQFCFHTQAQTAINENLKLFERC